MAGTMNWSDVYGEPSSPVQMAAPISAGGPGQSFVSPAFSGPGTGVSGGPAPTFSWLGMVLALVALRVAIELSDRA